MGLPPTGLPRTGVPAPTVSPVIPLRSHYTAVREEELLLCLNQSPPIGAH